MGRLRGTVQDEYSVDSRLTTRIRIPDKLQKVCSRTITRDLLARSNLGYTFSNNINNKAICRTNNSLSSEISFKRNNITGRPAMLPRKNCICSPVFSKLQASKSQDCTIYKRSEYDHSKKLSSNSTEAAKGIRVVEQNKQFHGKNKVGPTSSRDLTLDRCIIPGLRSSHQQWFLHHGRVVKCISERSHKRKRIADNSMGDSKFNNKRKCSGSNIHGQYGSNVCAKENGIQQISTTSSADGRHCQSNAREKIDNSSKILTRNSESSSRQFVQESNVSSRVENFSKRFPADNCMARTTTDRLYGHSMECSPEKIYLSSASPRGLGMGLLSGRAKTVESDLFVSTCESSFEGFEEARQLHRSWSSDCPILDNSDMVSSARKKNQEGFATSRSSQGAGHSWATKEDVLQLSRLQFLRYFLTKLHGKKVADDLAAAFRPSTIRQQENCWKKLQIWLGSKQGQLDKTMILQFLSYLFHDKLLAPNTVLAHRAALAFPLKLGFNINTEDKEFSLLAKSQFLARPPTQRVFPNWNLNEVLKLLMSNKYSYANAARDDLINKVIFLVALACGNRVSELAALYRPGMIFENNDDRVVIPVRPGFLFKNQRLRRAPPNISIEALREEGFSHPLCPVRGIRHILAVTGQEPCSALFTSSTGRALSKASIALRLTRIVDEAIPGCLPKAHDIRKQAGSVAWARGTPPQEIIRRGFWSSYDTFIARYLFPLATPQIPVIAMGSR